jgi:hypothetical protein
MPLVSGGWCNVPVENKSALQSYQYKEVDIHRNEKNQILNASVI